MKKGNGSTMGMTGSTTKAKKTPDTAPGMYGGRSHTPLGGGSETPRRGHASSGGIAYNGNCK